MGIASPSYALRIMDCTRHKVECPRSSAVCPHYRMHSGDQTDHAIFHSCRYPLFECRVHDCSKFNQQDVCGLVCDADSHKRNNVLPCSVLSYSIASLSDVARFELA